MTQLNSIFSLGDWQFMPAVGPYIGALIILVLAIIAVRNTRARRAELAHLRRDIGKLSEGVRYLVDAEQRRFLQALKASKDKDAAPNNVGPSQQPSDSGSIVTLIPQRDDK